MIKIYSIFCFILSLFCATAAVLNILRPNILMSENGTVTYDKGHLQFLRVA